MAESLAARNRLPTKAGSRPAVTADVEFGIPTAVRPQGIRSPGPVVSTAGRFRGPKPESFLPPLLFQELPDFIQLVRREFLIFDQLDEQRLRGSVEDALQKIVHHVADYFALRLSWRVDVGALIRALLQMTFLLENSHHRHHGRVSDLPAPEQFFINVADGRTPVHPDNFHDLEFLIGENRLS